MKFLKFPKVDGNEVYINPMVVTHFTQVEKNVVTVHFAWAPPVDISCTIGEFAQQLEDAIAPPDDEQEQDPDDDDGKTFNVRLLRDGATITCCALNKEGQVTGESPILAIISGPNRQDIADSIVEKLNSAWENAVSEIDY